jgi:hypothetical protein
MKKILLILFLFTQLLCINAQCNEEALLQTNPNVSLNAELNPRLKLVNNPINEFKNSFIGEHKIVMFS